MKTIALPLQGRQGAGLGLALVLLFAFCPAGPAHAQVLELPDWDSQQVLPPRLDNPSTGTGISANRGPRIRLFRFQTGFLNDAVGLEDDPVSGEAGAQAALAQTDPDTGPDWIQVAMGSDNPYFDFRLPGDPGGLGFYRVMTQVQLLDTGSTGCAVGLQAVTPAGQEYNGIDNGPTVVAPSLGVFHALDDGTALHGFVGKNVLVNATDNSRPIQRSLQYGMAVQRPVLTDGPDALRNLYFYVGALGQYRPDKDDPRPAVWEVLPGLHWKAAQNVWMSGGVVVPVAGPSRTESGLWQFTCSFRF